LHSNRHFPGLLSQATGARVFNVGYRNAPEHRFPAALDDAVAAYRWLLEAGTPPSQIALAGDSAGGGLALAVLLALRDAGGPLPGCAAVVSPWTDLALAGASITTNATTEMMLDPVGVSDSAALHAMMNG
jgi:acetyl esterase/lipase